MMKSEDVVTVDVRKDIREGREPFGRIMEAVATLKDGESLRLLAPFEPVPLFAVMARHGFSHDARATDSGDWEVLFARSSGALVASDKTPATSPSPFPHSAVFEVDARGLEPPQPLVVILEALARLPEGGELRAHTDRRPMHLYAQLDERGFSGETEAQSDGSFITIIRGS